MRDNRSKRNSDSQHILPADDENFSPSLRKYFNLRSDHDRLLETPPEPESVRQAEPPALKDVYAKYRQKPSNGMHRRRQKKFR